MHKSFSFWLKNCSRHVTCVKQLFRKRENMKNILEDAAAAKANKIGNGVLQVTRL
jgi:hypothetical protein